MDDLVNAPRMHPHVFGNAILADPERSHKLLQKNLSRVDRGHSLRLQFNLLMIIYNLNVESIRAVPAKTYSPLVVNADAILAISRSPQHFQTVSRWRSQVLQKLCCI
jgi:hypothetical protein